MGVPLIQVDVSREAIGRWLHCDIGVVGDARKVALALKSSLPARSQAEQPMRSEALRALLAQYQPEHDFEAQHTPRTLDPRTVGVELDRLLPQDRKCGVRRWQFFAMRHLCFCAWARPLQTSQ